MVSMKYGQLLIIISLFLFNSCSSDNRNGRYSAIPFETDSVSLKLKYAETSFIVPSPHQTSILLKKCNISYDDKLINSAGNIEKYTTTTKKSLALGVFGADLSYLNLYEQREHAVKFLQNIEVLMNELELGQALDKKIIKKIEANFGNNDSVLYYLSILYRDEDLCLKANDRRDVCSLIIAGGWIESFYFLTGLYSKTHKEEVFNLILFQSEILDNLIKLLSPYYDKSADFTDLIDDLVNIAYEFDVVDKIEPDIKSETDTILKKTIIYNKKKHILTGSRLENLARYATELRNKIILQ
jgi:hypothetical protein